MHRLKGKRSEILASDIRYFFRYHIAETISGILLLGAALVLLPLIAAMVK